MAQRKYPKIKLLEFTSGTPSADIEAIQPEIVLERVIKHFQEIIDPQYSSATPVWHDIDKESEDAVQHYARGYADATQHYAEIMQQEQSKIALTQTLIDNLHNLSNNEEHIENISQTCATLLSTLASKLALVLPVDFKRIITERVITLITSLQVPGKIIIRVSPGKLEYCRELIESHIPHQDVAVIADSAIAEHDCTVKWQDSRVEYRQEDIISHAIETISLLKNYN